MSISFVSSSAATSATGTVPGTVPAGLAADDLMVAIFSRDGGQSGTMDAPTGNGAWTANTAASDLDGVTGNMRSRAWYKLATAGDLSSIGNFVAGNGGVTQIVILAFRGVDTASPLVNQVTFRDPSTVTAHSIDASSVSPAGNAVAISVCCHYGSGGSWTVPSGYTSVYAPRNDGNNELVVSYKFVGPGSLGTLTNTRSTSATRDASLAVAFNEAVVRSAVLTRARQDRGLRLR